VRISFAEILSVATLGLMLACLAGLSGCDSKPADGTTIVNKARVLTDEQKAQHRKFYPDRSKKAGNRGGNP
jgi:hypothetical protein